MAEASMDTESRVKLAEIGGDIKRIFDHIERHGQDTQRTDFRLNNHAERITSLESTRNRSEGEHAGTVKTVKIAYVIGGIIASVITGLGAALLRAWGI